MITTIPQETWRDIGQAITTTATGVVEAVSSGMASITKKTTKSKTQTITTTKTTTKNKEKEKDNYWKANIGPRGHIIIGRPLSYDEALIRVQTNGDIMCRNIKYAEAISDAFPNSIGPEIDKNQVLGRTYYQHFHINSKHGRPHIWFYGT